MKNLLNLKGLCRSSQLALNPDGRTTVKRRSNDGHVRRHLPVGLTKLLSLFLLLTLGVGQMWGQAFGTVGQHQTTMQSQQIMSSGAYRGTVYEPFSTSTPSSYSPSDAPANAPSGPRRAGTFNTATEYGQSNQSPVGEPWVMLLMALAFGGWIAIKKYKHAAMVVLMVTLGVGQMWANTYFYHGNKNSWGYNAMTVSADGYYEYYTTEAKSNNNFLVSYSDGGGKSDYNYDQVADFGFNGTDMTNSGKWDGESNICFYDDDKKNTCYILVYYPNTTVNSTSSPKVCASHFLPDNRSCTVYFVDEQDWGSGKTMSAYAWYYQNDVTCHNNSGWPGENMTSTGKTYGGKNIYCKTLSETFDKVIFTNKSSGDKETANLNLGTTYKGKMFDCTNTDATWRTLAYDVTLDQQSGSGGTSSIIAVCGSAMPSSKTAPSRDGYIFDGYYTATSGEGTKYYNANMTSANTWPADGSGPTTLYANWTPITISAATITPSTISPSAATDITFSFTTNAPTAGGYKFRIKEFVSSGSSYGGGYEANDQAITATAPTAQTYVRSGVSRAAGTYKTQIELYKGDWVISTSDITLTVSGGGGGGSTTWYWIDGNGAHNGSENITKEEFEESATTGIYTLTRTLTNNQTFHLGNGSKGYGPASNTDVTASSTGLELAEYGSVYWFTFTPASQPVVLTLNTNVNPMTLSLSNPVYSVTMNTNGGTINAGGVTSYTYGTGATLPTNVTKTGYDFEGWFDNEGLTGSAVTAISNTATGDKEYWAKWTAKSYAVALKANDGSETTIATISATYDAAMPSADNTSATLVAPIRAGYTFNGYYDAASGGTQYYNSSLVSQRNWDKSSDVSLYAQWTERPYKIVYFADPGWSSVFVYAWDGNNEPTYKNASWPGVQLNAEPAAAGTGTEVINCLNYYYYKFYTDGLGADAEGADGSAYWTKIIFAQNNDATTTGTNKTGDLVLGTNKYYRLGDATDATGGATPFYDWYLMGSFNNEGASGWNNYTHPITMDACGNTGSIVMSSLSSENNQYFKIYRVSTNTTYKYTGGADGEYNDDREISSSEIGTPLTLRIYNSNVNYFRPTATTDYVFRLDVANTDNPVLTVAPNDMTEYNTSLSISGHGHLDKSTGTIQLKQYIPTTITATPEPGYRFAGWTTSGNVAFAGGTSSNDATASFTATADGATITANFSNEGFIYFDAGGVVNQWGDNVYVTFLKSGDWYYHSTNGGLSIANDSWVNNLHTRQMTRIGDSRIYYLDYTKAANGADISSSDLDQISGRVLFTSKSFATGTYVLYEMAAIKRGDFSKTSSNKLFVAENFREDDKNKTGYYVGYWMNYKEEDPGIKLDIHDGESLLEGIPVFQLIEGSDNEYTATYHLSGNNTYSLGLLGDNGTYYNNDNSSTMTSNSCTGWVYVDRQATPGHITTTADGDYKFTLTCSDRLTLSVEYPLSVGDYRLVYSGVLEDTTSAPAHVHPSKIIRQLASGVAERKDTVSFFVTGDWRITLEKCSRVTPEIVWEDACVSAEKSASDLGLSGKTGVYIFPLTLSNNNATGCDGVEIGTPQLYQGEYYIRTDVAKGGWEGYTRTYKSRMNYSDYAKMNSGFDYYNCQYAETNKNVKFTIANNYSFCVTDTLEGDKYVPTTGGNVGKLPYQANIRFMYNSATNVINRAYLNGSSEGGVNTFLWMQSTSTSGQPDLYKANGNELEKDTVKFRDHGNWVYQVDIQAEEQARVKLISNYHFNSTDHLQYFKGASGDWSNATTEEILGGTFKNDGADEKHNLRVIYDFKTNQLLSAWLVPASGDVPSTAINTDVMILRQNQDTARQITFASSEHSLTEVDTIYTAVNLTKSFLTTTGGEYERQFYWVSFPYEVKLSEVFGSVGTYGVDWIMQKYNGKKRAKGFWIDSEPNWEFMDISETLNPYEGYVLTLDMSEFGSDSEKWKNSVTELYLYFPSDRRIGSIVQQNITITMDQTGYLCDIERDNRNIKDSYWHCIGSPSFARATQNFQGHDGSAEQWAVANMPFLYEWNKATNELSPVAAGDYKFAPLTGYLVQYSAETISWTNLSRPATPASVAARRVNMEHMPEEVTYRLQLLKGETEGDRTYVRFSENEGVTAAFDFNQDLSKENKKGGNIWTVTGDAIPVAGNSLPMSEQTTVVPVGVKIAADGEYTFAMPDGTNGTGVTLIDNETGTRTSLGLTDYTVTLGKGDYRDRFYLEISPVKNIPTGMDNVQGDNVQDAKARKVLIDGILYIVKDGQVFDARGNKVQ